jgi:hypothetical protein
MEPTQYRIELTQGDRLQLFTCLQGLKVASESNGQMHLTHPRLVRSCAIHWLGRIGIKATSRTRWNTLYLTFKHHFGEVSKA